MITLDDLVAAMSPAEMKASLYAGLQKLGVPTTGWKSGAVVRTITAVCATILSAFSTLAVALAKSGFPELSSGDWLTLVAHYLFGVDRREATFATGEITLTNGGGGVFDFDPGDVVFLRPEAGASPAKTYRNTGVFHLGAGGTVTVDIQADEVGTASNAASGEISEFETPLIGVTCSNANAVIGIDEESDSELQAECREMADSLSPNGPRDAYSYFAKRAVRDDGSSVGVTRVKVSAPSQTAAVTITVATASGAVPGDVDDWETDLGLVDKTIQTNVTPDGITTTVRTGDLVTIAVTYEIWVYAWTGRTAAQIQSAVETALEAFIATQPIGGNLLPGQSVGYVYQDAIAAAIGAALPAGEIPHVVVTLPAADVELGDTDVPALGTVTCTEVHLVS